MARDRGRAEHRLDQRRLAGPGPGRRAGGRGAGRRGADRGPRPDGPHLGVAAVRRADLLPADKARCAARPARLAPAAHRRGRRRGGHRSDRRPSQAEVAQRPPGRRGQARRHPGRGGRRRGRRRHRPQRVHRTRRAHPPPGQPGPGALPATSLRAAGATALDRAGLLLAILAWFERWYQAWRQAGGDPDRSGLREEYVSWSATIGRTVRAELPGGQALSGPAAGVDSDGRLLVRVSSGAEVPVAAANVVHLR